MRHSLAIRRSALRVAALLLVAGLCACRRGDEVRLACFHGGKSYLLFRSYADGGFDREGVRVGLYSKFMGKPGFRLVPRSFSEFYSIARGKDGQKTYFGKVSGTEIAQALSRGHFDGGTLGESSFLLALSRGEPLVAVAMLGHDTREAPAKAIVLRKGVRVGKPADLKGKTLISRRGGPGEAVMLREFLLSVGLTPGKDVKVVDQVEEDDVEPLLQRNEIDGGLYHVSTIRRLLKSGDARIYRRMDWMDPELSHGLLVFRKDFVKAHPEEIVRLLRAYVQMIRSEMSLPRVSRPGEERPELHDDLGVTGMDLPRTDDPPWVRAELLEELGRLFIKHGIVTSRIEVRDAVDTALLKKALEEPAR